jgi:hypothetical protein
MELINPSCSAERPNASPNWGRIPARIENVKAVVMSAKQLPLNKAFLLMFSFIKFKILSFKYVIMRRLMMKQYMTNW